MIGLKWLSDNRLEIKPPKKLKKVTGTRFASVLGSNVWSTPFEMWLAITKTYEKPFEDSIYTIAGKTIEPKQAQYMKDEFLMSNLVSPEDIYGKDYFSKTYGDFFPESKIFGGMWDFLLVDENGKPTTVLEMKTSKRSEDWVEDIPEYYALQAALYAHLLGVDDVIFVATFLQGKDYDDPTKFEVTSDNTIIRRFSMSERYPHFDDLVNRVEEWHDTYVKTGVSPQFDEKKDAELLKALRTNTVETNNTEEVIKAIELLQERIDKHNLIIADDESNLKKLKDVLKEKLQAEFREGDTNVEVQGEKYKFNLAKSTRETINKKKLQEDNLLDKYIELTDTYTLRIKGDK